MGGLPLILMILGSVLTLAVVIERTIYLWQFSSRAQKLFDQVKQFIQERKIEAAETICLQSIHPVAKVFLEGLKRKAEGKIAAIPSSVDRERQRVSLKLRKPLWILGTVGATTPFVGLFGTVVGIMSSFRALSTAKKAGFEVVGPGITEALVSTAVGIGVAIAALIGFNYFQTRIGRINTEIKLMTEEFVEEISL